MTDKFFNRVIFTLILAVLLTGAWVLGKRHGAREAYELASRELSSVEAQGIIEQLQVSLRQTEQDLADKVSALEADAARTQALRDLLDEQMRQKASDDIDLALYRKIETSQKDPAVEVESLDWDASQPDILNLTLVQWQGRNRVRGEVAVTLGWSESKENEAKTSEVTVDLPPMSFDFRFFQTFMVPMAPNVESSVSTGKSSIPDPQYVDVRIAPADERLRGIEIRFSWSDVAE
ncbi:MAG: hypothetical protein AB8B87_06335 [Granulosicoccus sp.]